MKKVVTLIQVRMKSTRLPRKVLCLIEDKPLIEHVIDRLRAAKTPDEILICTSSHPDDQVLAEIAEKNKLGWFAGSEEDVLDRFVQAARKAEADVVVRTCGENPLIDPVYHDRAVREHLESGADYTSPKGFPSGVKVEVINTEALERAHDLADNPEMSEYMTLYFGDDFFKVHSVEVEDGLKRPHYRLTVDTPEDLELVRQIYAALYKPGRIISLEEAIHFLDERPGLVAINQHHTPRKVIREVIIRQGKPKIRITED